jgi:hypothetical protein
MPTQFKHAVTTDVGTTPVDVLQIPGGVKSTVIGCNLANTTDEDVIVDVFVVDEFSTQAFFVRGLMIPPYNAAKIITNSEKLILPAQAGIRIVSDTENSVDVTISYVEIS